MQAKVTAYIDNGNSTGHLPANAQVTSLGAMSITATDGASINASSEMTSINTPVNDGGAGLINHYADLVLNAYQYTEKSGSQTLNFGDKVWVGNGDGTGTVYRWMGTTQSVNLLSPTFAYTNLEYWKPLSQSEVVQEAETDIIVSVAGEVLNKKGLTGETLSLYLLFDFNNVSSAASTYIVNATTSSASLSVQASDTASITAADSSVVTSGTNGNGGGDGAGGVLATNHVVGNATADIQFSSVTTTTGDVSVEADNHSTITATENTVLNSEGKAGTLMAAFNVIGWSADHFGDLAVDALLGTDTLLGNANTPDLTKAFIDASTVTAARNVTVTAIGAATITASAGDKSGTVSSLDVVFSAKDGPSALNVGGVLVTNKVLTKTLAYIDNGTGTSTVGATTGSIHVTATDQDAISATSTIDLTAASFANESAFYQVAVQLAHQDYLYTDKSGSQFLNDGDRVYVGQGSDGAPLIYQYQGPTTKPNPQNPNQTVPLSVNLATADYTDIGGLHYWAKIQEGAPTLASLLPNLGNLTNAGSKALGLIFVFNDVRGKADATVTGATLTAGQGIGLAANEAAAILAVSQNTVTSSGGNSGLTSGSGVTNGSLAANGTVVTNLVLASALASADQASLSAGAGGISINAQNAAQMDATALVSSTTSGGGAQAAGGLVLAFNSIGWAPENFVFNAAAALLGDTYLADPSLAANATAFIHDTTIVHDGGDLSVIAQSVEQINATISNAATSTASAFFGATSGSFGGVLASNKVNGKANAYIDESDLSNGAYAFSITGNLTVKATDASGVYSNAKLVSSSTTTNDGGAGLLQNELNAATPADFITAPDNGVQHLRTVKYGQTVRLSDGYDTPTDTVGGLLQTAVTVNPGDVVQNNDAGNTLYRYIGSAPGVFDLSGNAASTVQNAPQPPDFTDATKWAQIAGKIGQVYIYMGPNAGTQLDLNNTDYSDLNFWKPSPTANLIPQGLNVDDSNASAVGALIVLNDVRSKVTAYVTTTSITAGGTAAVTALDQATIKASNDSTVTAEGGEALGSGTEVSKNGIIVTNVVQSSADAHVASSSITSNLPLTSGSPAAIAISIDAENVSTIEATNAASTSSAGNGYGVVLAFNTIGWHAQNFLFNAADALIGEPELIATGSLANVTAYAQSSSLVATHDSISVQALENESVTATTTNTVTSLASALAGENSSAAGLMLATNMVNGQAQAYVDSSTNTSAGGTLSILARDNASINATDTQTVSSTSISDGGQSLLKAYLAESSTTINIRSIPASRC